MQRVREVLHCASFFKLEGVGQKVAPARKWGEVGSQIFRKFFKMKLSVTMLHLATPSHKPEHPLKNMLQLKQAIDIP